MCWVADDFSVSDPENLVFDIASTFNGARGTMGAPFCGLSWQGPALLHIRTISGGLRII